MNEYTSKNGSSIKYLNTDGIDIITKIEDAHLSVDPDCQEFLETVEMNVVVMEGFQSFTYRTKDGYTTMLNVMGETRLIMKSLVMDEVQAYSIFSYKGNRIVYFNEPNLFKMFVDIDDDANFIDNSLKFMLYVICGEEK